MAACDRYATSRAMICQVLAADCGCPEAALTREGVTIVAARPEAARFRFRHPSRALTVLTTGAGVVIRCAPERVAWAEATFGRQARDELFSADMIATIAAAVARDDQVLYGPTLIHAASADRLRPAAPPPGISVSLVEEAAVVALYTAPGFPHALSYTTNTARPDRLAAVARDGATIVGIAAASADSDKLWQIGVDVLASHRGRGVGRAVVGAATAAVLARGIIPFYGAAVSNLASRATALGLGYWPAWTMLRVRDRPPVA